MNKKVIISVVILVVAVLAWWLFASKPVSAPVDTMPAVGEFSQDLSGLDQVDLEADLQSLDADLKAL